MGKEGELWDDSALINAFDHAIHTYKKVHAKAQLDSSKALEQETNGTGEVLSTCNVGNNVLLRQAAEDNNNNVISHSTPEQQDTGNELPSEENQQEPNWKSSCEGRPKSQGTEDYNQLMNRYYEIEEQRQKIIQELEPYNYWNYQQPNHSSIAPPYDPYVNQCMVAPCYLGGSCTSANSGMNCSLQSTIIEDSSTVTKAALAAAEKAISSLKIAKPENQEGVQEQLESRAAGETDLNAVFSAWYTAGFYTGKYLAEHSIAKKHQG